MLRDLSLWDKKDSKIMTLSGGMKRRVLIAKALSHEPQILFLDEPTAGVDVELRRDMWEMVRSLRDTGVTIILTTHYIEEAEEMADRIGVINKGEIILVEDKAELDAEARQEAADAAPAARRSSACPRRSRRYALELSDGRQRARSTPSTRRASETGIATLLDELAEPGIDFKDLQTDAELARGHLRQPGEARTHEHPRHPRDLPVRDGAHLAHADAEHHLAGDLDLALLHRVRLGDRLAHHRRSTASPTALSSSRA